MTQQHSAAQHYSAPQQAQSYTHVAQVQPQKFQVVVRDVDMSFMNMVFFMVKWAIASIPAVIILAFLGFFLSIILMMVFGMLGMVGMAAGA